MCSNGFAIASRKHEQQAHKRIIVVQRKRVSRLTVILAVFLSFQGQSLMSETPPPKLKSAALDAYAWQLSPSCRDLVPQEICEEPLFFHVEPMRPLPDDYGDPQIREFLPNAFLSLTNPDSQKGRVHPCPVDNFRPWALERVKASLNAEETLFYQVPLSLTNCVGGIGFPDDPKEYLVGFYQGRVAARVRLGRQSRGNGGSIGADFYHPRIHWSSHFTTRQLGDVKAYVPILSEIVTGAWTVFQEQGYPVIDARDIAPIHIIEELLDISQRNE